LHRWSITILKVLFLINKKDKLQAIPLSQCPDPNAFVEITFDYVATGENLDTSMR